MFHNSPTDRNLLGRNEGKIKSFESCVDVRAWNHDLNVRYHYLRDWIKCDMQICVIPMTVLTELFRTMTWKRRNKVVPQCNPKCKSKLVLNSICNSCHIVKECLKNEPAFDKYFIEEELEATHWPCDRCLEALKAIKMFWKIIMERIFKIENPKSEISVCTSNESIRTVARVWQNEIIEEALIVKALSPFLNNPSNSSCYYKISEINSKRHNDVGKDVGTEVDDLLQGLSSKTSICPDKKISRCTSAMVIMVDASCNTTLSKEKMYQSKKNQYLKHKQNLQNEEIRILKRENLILKIELETKSQNLSSHAPLNISDSNNVVAPPPFESCCDGGIKHVDSEMIITLKNCKNTNFKHVSMLQVLHKTNTVFKNDAICENCYTKNEDPIQVLTKVRDTFKEIVEREISFAMKKNMFNEDMKLNSSYHKVNATNMAYRSSSQSMKSSHSALSDSIFVSTTEVL